MKQFSFLRALTPFASGFAFLAFFQLWNSVGVVGQARILAVLLLGAFSVIFYKKSRLQKVEVKD